MFGGDDHPGGVTLVTRRRNAVLSGRSRTHGLDASTFPTRLLANESGDNGLLEGIRGRE